MTQSCILQFKSALPVHEVRCMKLLTLSSELRDFALITHAVPADRVRKHLPKEFELETFSSEEDKELALISVGCFFNRHFHWSTMEHPDLNFDQITYRTYVRYKNRIGVYFFSTYLGTFFSYCLQRSMCTDAAYAKFKTHRNFNQRGYTYYNCHAECAQGETWFNLTATHGQDSLVALRPHEVFVSGNELAQHLTYRLHGFFKSPIGYMDQFVSHVRMHPLFGQLNSGRFELWEKLGILTPTEATSTFCVLVQPKIQFLFYLPIPIRILPMGKEPIPLNQPGPDIHTLKAA